MQLKINCCFLVTTKYFLLWSDFFLILVVQCYTCWISLDLYLNFVDFIMQNYPVTRKWLVPIVCRIALVPGIIKIFICNFILLISIILLLLILLILLVLFILIHAISELFSIESTRRVCMIYIVYMKGFFLLFLENVM